jgi:hypothetical protein
VTEIGFNPADTVVLENAVRISGGWSQSHVPLKPAAAVGNLSPY